MKLEEHAKSLAIRAKSRVGDTVVAYEVMKWPEGRLQQFIEMGLLRPLPDADEIRCPGCTDSCMIVPIRTILPNGEPYAEHLCGKEGLVEIPDFLFKCWQIVINKMIELGYYHETQDNRGKREKEKTKKQAKKKNFEHWPSPGDACFIIENERIEFHYDGEIKDLKLKKDSNADQMIKYLQAPVSGKIIKKILCSPGTRPSDLKDQTNEQLNKKIATVGFIMPMNNIEFIRFVDTRNEYECVLEIYQSRGDFTRLELEQSLVDDRRFKDLDTAEDQY